MKCIVPLLAAVALFFGVFGCENHSQTWNDKGRIYKMVDIDSGSDFSIFCDRSTNIAYLRYWVSEHKNGFTVYYNSDGQPARCNEIRK